MSLNKSNTWFSLNIVNFVNPHFFHFKINTSNVLEQKIESLLDLELKQQNKEHIYYLPKLSEFVAAFIVPWNKWVRAQIDSKIIFDSQKYVIWCMDYG